MRISLLLLMALLGCATSPGPRVDLPPVEANEVRAIVRPVDVVGDIRPLAVAITNGRTTPLTLNPVQIFALPVAADGSEAPRVAPIVPAEAARQAGGDRLPGAVKGSVKGATTGGVSGAVNGAISGALGGAAGGAAGVGAVLGAAMGAINGALGGAETPADVEGFSSRALQPTVLQSGFSATGYVYFPKADYPQVEILLSGADQEAPMRLVVPVQKAD